jgi:hypothetical protein
MPKNKRFVPPSRRRIIAIVSVIALFACGIVLMGWTQVYSGIPQYTQLKEANVSRWSGRSVEFYDDSGRRYQMLRLNQQAMDQVASARSMKTPVVIRYGPWVSPFPSESIFTGYQLEIDGHVIIPYSECVAVRQRRQAMFPLVVVCYIPLVGVALFVAMRLETRFWRRLESVSSKNNDGCRTERNSEPRP